MQPPLDTSAIGFSLVNAKACALASKLAYEAATITDPRTDTQVNITCSLGGDMIIAFRGTRDLRNWITDAEAWWGAIKGVNIHFGFLGSIRNVISAVLKAVNDAKPKNIFICGHSLGGALAMLCASELFLENIPIHSIYTFGQPRVGSAAFRDRYNRALRDITYRVVNADDLVARLAFLIFGYRHAGQLVFFDAFGGMKLNASVAKMALSDLAGEINAYGEHKLLGSVLDPLRHHPIDRYLEIIP